MSPVPSQRLLTWRPPELTNPRVVTVTDDRATRRIDLAPGEDLLLLMPNTISNASVIHHNDALVQVVGGRNVVLIGGHIRILHTAQTITSGFIDATATELPVVDTSQFPAVGALRVDGEPIKYSGKTPNSFVGCTRNFGFYNDSPISSKTHQPGAVVYQSEAFRQALTVSGQTGTVHIEGLLIDGVPNDGIRIQGGDGSTYQIQNCRIGPTQAQEPTYQTDGHPDSIQIIRGPDALRMDRVTLLTDAGGRCLLNKGSDASRPMVSATLRDVEFAATGNALELVRNHDAVTTWQLQNVWAYTQQTNLVVGPGLSSWTQLRVDREWPTVADFCPVGVAGGSYVSPGYL